MNYLKGREMYTALMKHSARGRIMGFDVGEKYVGVAVSDRCYQLALPLRVLYREKLGAAGIAEEVQKMVKRYTLSAFVVGWPMDHQKPTPPAVHVQSFIDGLSESGKFNDMLYTKWDEGYTSKVVAKLTKPINMHPVKKKAVSDMYAAVYILQDYLDEMSFDEM